MYFIGVDGCKDGWFVVLIDENNAFEFRMLKAFSDIRELAAGAAKILVDIPIGLRSHGRRERGCDLAARKILGPRASSVFPAPVRQAISQSTYESASERNFKACGRKLSKQSWAIIPKIREVDEFVRTALARGSVREMHPEVCFWGLNGRVPMDFSKKKAAGFSERMELLTRHYEKAPEVYENARKNWFKKQLADDDILDALVGSVTALKDSMTNDLLTLPTVPELDDFQLPMEMVYVSSG